MPSTGADDDDLSGRALGDFVLRQPLGQGGSGTVYLAEQAALQRVAVIKVLRRDKAPTPARTQRFLREAQLASRLDHPYAAHIYAFGAEPDGLRWIAMEHVRGTPLDQVLQRQGAMPLEHVVPLVQRLCEVVHSAHELGIVHRDIKPANVMVMARAGARLPKLLDFGIAKQLDEPLAEENLDEGAAELESTGERRTLDQKLTQAGAFVGTPQYMAPEQWVNGDIGPHTDIYALGVLTYELLTGVVPFDGKSVVAIARAHAQRAIPPLGDELPAQLEGVLARAMAKRGADRFASALELADALRVASGLGAVPEGLPQVDAAIREAALATAPQPLAEAVAVLEAVRSVHQAREAAWEVLRVAARLLGLYTLAARVRVGPGGDRDADAVLDLLRALRRRGLSEREWVALARELVTPFARSQEAHPLPEVVGVFFDPDGASKPGPFAPLLELRDRVELGVSETVVREQLATMMPLLSSLVREMRVLAAYPLVVSANGEVQRWTGVRRPRRERVEPRGRPIPDGAVALLGEDDVPVLLLSPLVQALAPAPGAALEPFLLEGKGTRGARLSAPPGGFVHEDEALWDWFRRTLLDEGAGAGETAAESDRAPYRGLASFTTADRDFYFGREREIEIFCNRLRTSSLLVVVGPSGAGKSSFVHAGVVGALAEGSRVITLRPGSHPTAALWAALGAAGVAPGPDEDIAGKLAAGLTAPDATALLIVDQLEELFTMCGDASERERFAAALAAVARRAGERVRVALTIRDDFLMRTQELPALREPVQAGVHLLGALRVEDLRRVVIEPARRVGYELEDERLVEQMVSEVAGVASALPLLSFTAARLWEQRDRQWRQLTRKAYEALGGVAGALAGHADAMLAALGIEEQRLVRDAFRHLVTAEGTRATLSRDELVDLLGGGPRALLVIERLIDSRLVASSEGERGATRIEIAHEALITAWPRLVEWRREDAEGARLRDQLRAAARQWEERGRPRGLLWRDEALAEYELWRARHPQPLTRTEEDFAARSLAEARRARRLRAGALTSVVVALAAGLLIFAQLNRRSQASAREARDRLAAFHEEQGRQLFLAGDPLRSLVYLSHALELGRDTVDLRFLLARAFDSLEAEQLRLAGHTDRVTHVAFIGRDRLVSAARDGSARLWDVAAGRQLLRVEHAGVEWVEATADAAWLLTSGAGTARLWEVATGREVRRFDHLPDRERLRMNSVEIADARLEPRGRRMAVLGDDHLIRIWPLAGEAAPLVLRGHAADVNCVAWSEHGDLLVSGDDAGQVIVWDAATGRSKQRLAVPGPVRTVALTPDGERVIVGDAGGRVRLLQVASARVVVERELELQILSASFAPDGRTFVARQDGASTLQLWDGKDGVPRKLIAGHRGIVTAMRFSPDGGSLVTTGTDGLARVWSVATGRMRTTLAGHDGQVLDASWSSDGERVATAGYDGTIRLWTPRPVGLVQSLGPFGDIAIDARFSADGRRVIADSNDGDGKIWDATTGALLTEVSSSRLGSGGAALVFDQEGTRAVVGRGGRVEVWDTTASEPRVLHQLPEHRPALQFAVFAPDGSRLVTTSDLDGVRIWSGDGARQERSIPGARVTWLGIDTRSERLVTAGEDGLVHLWELPSGRLLRSFTGHVGRAESGVLSRDRRTLLTAGLDQTVRLWDTSSGVERARLTGHVGQTIRAYFTPDEQLIVSGGIDGLRIWSSSSGRQLSALDDMVRLPGGCDEAGRYLLVGAATNLVEKWRIGRNEDAQAVVASRVRCRVPFRLIDDHIVVAAPDRTACPSGK